MMYEPKIDPKVREGYAQRMQEFQDSLPVEVRLNRDGFRDGGYFVITRTDADEILVSHAGWPEDG